MRKKRAAVANIQPGQKIPYFSASRQYEDLKLEIQTALGQVLSSGAYILGPEVTRFEESFAAYTGSRFAVGTGSGTDALVFALKSLGIGKGDEVILPSFTFVATGFAVLHAGATPVFADVLPGTYTIDPASAEKLITRKTKALLPVHLYGHAADMSSLMKIAKKHRLKLIEDTAQAHGSMWNGQMTGSFGDAGCFSFYPTKNLGACGDGGMVVTSKASLAQKVRELRNLGRIGAQGPHKELAWTSRLDSIQAAILNVKLKHLESFIEKRRAVADRYREYLAGLPLRLPSEHPKCRHVYHLFVVLVAANKREAFRKYLSDHGVPTLLHYPIPVHRQPPFKKFKSKSLPVTEKVSRQIVSLPIFPEMTTAEVRYVSDCIREYYKVHG